MKIFLIASFVSLLISSVSTKTEWGELDNFFPDIYDLRLAKQTSKNTKLKSSQKLPYNNDKAFETSAAQEMPMPLP
jgi:hypothetical protein